METQYDLVDIVVARVFDIDPAMLCAETRKERAAFARFLAFRLRAEQDLSNEEIGRLYNRDQETVRRGIRKAAELEQYDKGFRTRCEKVAKMLGEGMIPYETPLSSAPDSRSAHARTAPGSPGWVPSQGSRKRPSPWNRSKIPAITPHISLPMADCRRNSKPPSTLC